jgi:hypothetical protein
MGQPGYGWGPPGQPPPRSGGNNRIWIIAVAVAAALVLMGGVATAAVLILRDNDEDPVADPTPPVVDPQTGQPDPNPDPTETPSLPSPDNPLPPAGDGFDVTLDPTFGEETISSGFTPDPMTVDVTSGGSIDAAYLDAIGCRGYGARAPDFRLRWEGSGGLLRFFFVPDETGRDTGMVVNAPDGSWNCNDDSYATLNPTVDFAESREGQYDIWVTTYGTPGEFIPGTLSVTELSSQTPGG